MQYEHIQARVNVEIKARFEEIFIESGSNSKGEFVAKLLDRYMEPEKVVEKLIEIEKEVEKLVVREVPARLKDNEILVTLSPIQQKLLLLAVEVFDSEPDPDWGDVEESQGDLVFKEQNYYAVSPSVIEKYGDLFTPLIQGENNMSRILINSFAYGVYKGWEICPQVSRSELREMNALIRENQSKKNNILEVLKDMSDDEIQQLRTQSKTI